MSAPVLTSIVVVDASADFRWIIRRALQREGGFDIVADTGDAAAGVDLARTHRPHVVLLDVDGIGAHAAAAVRAIRTTCPGTDVVATMALGGPEVHDAVMAADARGVLRRGSSPQRLVRQLWSVLAAPPASSGVPGASWGPATPATAAPL